MNNLVSCEDRLKKMLISDKSENPARIERVIKSELLYLLKNYFEISSEDFRVDIRVRDDGRYELNINGVSRTIKIAHLFSE